MSPYYAASPIVFEDRPCEGQASSGGSQEELKTLQEQGRKQPAEPAAVGKTPGVAVPAEASGEGWDGKTPGVKETAAPAPAVAGASASTSEKLFVGSVNSNLYHHKDCATASRIKKENQLWFTSTAEAESAGYSPSKCTRDKLGL